MTKEYFGELNKNNIVKFLGDFFEKHKHKDYLGESVSITEHMLQGATIAEEQGLPEDVIVSALLHDIGHLTRDHFKFSMSDKVDKFHEVEGADLLFPFFPTLVIDCVRYHVAAKRYLCRVRKSYFNDLSSASLYSLGLQGGQMSNEETSEFEKLENLEKIILVRELDDAGKKPGFKTPNFWHFAPMVERLVNQREATKFF